MTVSRSSRARAGHIFDRSLSQLHHALSFLTVLGERGLPELGIDLLDILQRAAIVDRAEELASSRSLIPSNSDHSLPTVCMLVLT